MKLLFSHALRGQKPSVHGQCNGVDHAGVIAEQEQYSVHDFFHLCEPAERDLGEHGAALGRVQPQLAHVREDDGGVDTVDADLVLAELKRQDPRGLVDGGLGRSVRSVALESRHGRLRGDVDDAAAPAALHHVPGHDLADVEDGRQVHVECALEALLGHVQEVLNDGDGGVVDEAVDGAQAGESGARRVPVGQVDGDGLEGGRAQLGGQRVEVGARPGHCHYLGLGGHQSDHQVAADALAGAGDQDALPGEVERRCHDVGVGVDARDAASAQL